MSSISPTTTQQIQNFISEFYSRKLLLINSAAPPLPATTHHDSSPEAPYAGANNSFDANVVMVLSVLLCALICSLGLNSIIRCALRCSNFISSNNSSAVARPNSISDTGIKKKALKTFPTVNYSVELKLPSLDIECVICLSEFANGEKVRLLPKCNHGFHVRCIDKWLSSHSSCPKCRHCLIETCQKIVGSSTSSSYPPQETVITVPAPLQPEGFIRSYRENQLASS